MEKSLLGVTLGWDLKPHHLWQWADGYEGIISGYRLAHPEHFDTDGWPLDPVTRERLEIYVEPGMEAALTPWQTRFMEWIRRQVLKVWGVTKRFWRDRPWRSR